MRLFTAIDISDEVRANIESLQKKLKPFIGIQWSPPGNLHITTKFIGEWPQERLEELKAAFDCIPPVGFIEIEVRGIGWYPNSDAPRMLWAGVHASPTLYDLAKATDAAMAPLGVPVEERVYSPHLTLARIQNSQPHVPVPQEFGRFSAARYHLYLSEPSIGGSRYSKLADFSLIP